MAFRQVLDNDTNMKSVICYFKCLPSSTKETTGRYIYMLAELQLQSTAPKCFLVNQKFFFVVYLFYYDFIPYNPQT